MRALALFCLRFGDGPLEVGNLSGRENPGRAYPAAGDMALALGRAVDFSGDAKKRWFLVRAIAAFVVDGRQDGRA